MLFGKVFLAVSWVSIRSPCALPPETRDLETRGGSIGSLDHPGANLGWTRIGEWAEGWGKILHGSSFSFPSSDHAGPPVICPTSSICVRAQIQRRALASGPMQLICRPDRKRKPETTCVKSQTSSASLPVSVQQKIAREAERKTLKIAHCIFLLR